MIFNVPKKYEEIFNRLAAVVEGLSGEEDSESVLELIEVLENGLDELDALIGTGVIS